MGKMAESENSIKAFTIPYEAWYKDVVILGKPHIQIGMYYEDGSCDGEFKIVWDDIGIQLRAYDDSWEVLRHMPELIDLMGRIWIEELNPTIVEFAEMLKGIGFKDITEREKEDKVGAGSEEICDLRENGKRNRPSWFCDIFTKEHQTPNAAK